MTRQNLWLMINTLIIIIISLGFILVNETSVPKEPIDSLFGQMVELSDPEIINEIPTIGHYDIVHTVQTATNRKGEVVGVVYFVVGHNDFGYIELLVGIDTNQKIWVQPNKIDQTVTYVGGVQDHVHMSYQGIEASGLIGIDLEAGTTATRSTTLIKSLVGKAIIYHFDQNASLSEVNLG